MNFNIEMSKMLEVISREPVARRFAYALLLVTLLLVIVWKLPEILTAFSLLVRG